MSGPLQGYKIIEIAGIGPGPFCGMMLADMGAEVIRVDRPGGNPGAGIGHDVLFRNRRSIAVNLKSDAGKDVILKMCESADALFEGFRPGVTERLGIGPDDCMARNPKLVYGRMTGWGQTGPMAKAAGHDINYIALSGALHSIGRPGERPVPPLNLVGDFGGGGLFLAFGIVCGLLEAQSSGKGQVIDTAMVEGASTLMAMFHAMTKFGYTGERGSNMLDGAAHFYDTYETKDGKYMAVGSIEPQFYKLLLEKTGVDPAPFAAQMDQGKWPELKATLAEVFKTKTRDEWTEIFGDSDACVAPILSLTEAPDDPHNKARESFVEVDGMTQPAPAPKFSRTRPDAPKPVTPVGTDTDAVLNDFGFADDEIAQLKSDNAIAQV